MHIVEKRGEKMTCKYLEIMPDGFHGYCNHPSAKLGDSWCVLNTNEECTLQEDDDDETEYVG